MHTDKTVIKSNFPQWFVVFLSVCLGITFAIVIFLFIRTLQVGIKSDSILKIFIFFGITFGGLYFVFRILFYSVEASVMGLRASNLFWSDKLIFWEDVVEVKPFLWKYSDFSFVISKNNEKMLLVKSMKGYQEIIKMMNERATALCKNNN